MTTAPGKPEPVPPRMRDLITIKIAGDGSRYIVYDGKVPPLNGQVYVSLAEHESALREARVKEREDFCLKEVTYWIGEHRAYVEAGMLWEAELAMKNSRRYGDLARSARERNAGEGE